MTGAPVFLREILAHSRRPRTYAFQTIFLAILVVALIPLWPTPGGTSSTSAVPDRARWIFEWGGYLQIVLMALLAPAITANAIVEEKGSNTLDLLLLTGAGPFSIVWGKFFSRLFVLGFLLFLTVPLLFALLTLGGVPAKAIGVLLSILTGFTVLTAGVGVFLSTVLPRTPGVLLAGYTLWTSLLGAPAVLGALNVLPMNNANNTWDVRAAWLSPIYDMAYLFHPAWFVGTESFPTTWWIAPAWNIGAGLLAVAAAGLILPHAREVERLFSPKARGEGAPPTVKAAPGKEGEGSIGARNPVLWKETKSDTIGWVRIWWNRNARIMNPLLILPLLLFSAYCWGVLPDPKPLEADLEKATRAVTARGADLKTDATVVALTGQVDRIKNFRLANITAIVVFVAFQVMLRWSVNAVVVFMLLGGYAVFKNQLDTIEFHKTTIAVILGLLSLLATILAAATVSREREDGTLELLATTPLECATYVRGKVLGIGRNIGFVVALPFIHLCIWIAVGVISPWTFGYLALGIPVAVASSVVQGLFVSLLFQTTLRAIMAAVVVVCLEAALPLVCCVPTFNLPLMGWYFVDEAEGRTGVAPGTTFTLAKLFAALFSAGTHLGFLFVIYSLIRSDFDRYIGRAA